jgi:hypothetical protein
VEVGKHAPTSLNPSQQLGSATNGTKNKDFYWKLQVRLNFLPSAHKHILPECGELMWATKLQKEYVRNTCLQRGAFKGLNDTSWMLSNITKPL